MVVELARRCDLFDAAAVHHDDAVGDVHRLLLVMRDDHGGRVSLVVQPPQPDAQLLAHARVERAERLVQKEHLRVDRERAREAHALALAARQLRRVAVAEPRELDEVEQLRDALFDLGGRPATDLQAERDVLAHRHVLERRVVLEDEADTAFLRRHSRNVLAFEEHLASIGTLEPGDHAQQRRLAAAARAEQRRQRPRFDLDRGVVQGREVAEALDDAPCLDQRVSSFGFSAVMSTRVATAINASTTAAAYAPTSSNPW
jgi:hypothetical protein